MIRLFRLLPDLLPAVAVALATSPALARGAGKGSEWAEPIVDFLEGLTSGIGLFGIGVCGLGLMLYALYSIFTGQFAWQKFLLCFGCGFMILAGPHIAKTAAESWTVG